jgi:DNA uptake protein ComE-like DNA-binding protein
MLILLAGCSAFWLAWATTGCSPGAVDFPVISVDANSVPEPVLGALPGLGPVLSRRIVEARPFGSLDHLDRRVKGIGPAKVAGLRPFLRFDPPRP